MAIFAALEVCAAAEQHRRQWYFICTEQSGCNMNLFLKRRNGLKCWRWRQTLRAANVRGWVLRVAGATRWKCPITMKSHQKADRRQWAAAPSPPPPSKENLCAWMDAGEMMPIYLHNYYSLNWKNLLNVPFLYVYVYCLHLFVTTNSLLADTQKAWVFHFVVMRRNRETTDTIVIFVKLNRSYLIFTFFNYLTGRKKTNTLHFSFLFTHIMHTWAPSYNQTLPSIYQIVNGLIKLF